MRVSLLMNARLGCVGESSDGGDMCAGVGSTRMEVVVDTDGSVNGGDGGGDDVWMAMAPDSFVVDQRWSVSPAEELAELVLVRLCLVVEGMMTLFENKIVGGCWWYDVDGVFFFAFGVMARL